ncbi:MAG: hypothetical protein R6X02_15745 [Enhygromyxa sp.]
MRRLAAGLLVGVLIPQTAVAGSGGSGKPAAEEQAPEVGELSQQGTRRGGLEIGLGVLLSGTAIALIAFGTVQFIRAREHLAFCNRGVTYIDEGIDGGGGGIDPCVFDPPPLGFASAGLSWGFSIPLLVGSGLLFARARRVIGDARAFDRMQLSLAPWWQREGGGASLSLRF